MSIEGLIHIKKALSNLNPEQVRVASQRPVRIAIEASGRDEFERVAEFLLADLSPARREQSRRLLSQGLPSGSQPADIVLYTEGVFAPSDALIVPSRNPQQVVPEVLERFEDLGVALARSFPPFRAAYIAKVIARTAKENTIFSLTTALPDVIPNLIELPWAVAEFASDTAFITMNQLRMAFLIAAASDREIGYREQKSEIATVIASAFGWRALARQIVGKVPFGGGLLAKSAVAYAATRVLGLSLDQFYRIGYVYSRSERKQIYAEAFERGKTVAGRVLSYLRPDLASKIIKDRPAKSAKGTPTSGSEARV